MRWALVPALVSVLAAQAGVEAVAAHAELLAHVDLQIERDLALDRRDHRWRRLGPVGRRLRARPPDDLDIVAERRRIRAREVDEPFVDRAPEPDIEPGGGSMNEPYRLPAGVEFVLVLAGQLEVTVAGEEVTLEEGDALTFTADMEHTFQAPPRTGRARVLWVLSPALPDHGIELPPPAG